MRRILRLINEISLWWMVIGLWVAIFGFAGLYWVLDYSGAGLLEFGYDTELSITLFDCLYFSLITISSLGYGDIHPLGWSRMVSGAEVMIGLAFFGLLVAKISSIKQDYILRRLYYADVIDHRLENYAETLEEARQLYRITSNMLIGGEMDPELTTTFKSDVEESTFFYQVHTLLQEIRDLVVFEVHNGGFFDNVSDSLVGRIYASIQGLLSHTLRLAERDFDMACEHIFCGNEELLEELVEMSHEIARIGRGRSRSSDIKDQCRSVEGLSDKVRTEVLERIET